MATLRGKTISLALAALVVVGCDAIDPRKLVPDGSLRSRCVQLAAQGCVTREALVCDEVAGGFSLVLPSEALYQRVDIQSPRSGEGAVAVDWVDGLSDVAGLVVSRPSDLPDASSEAVAISEALQAAQSEFQSVRVVSEGRRLQTPDGNSLRIEVELELTVRSTTSLARARDLLYPILLGGSLARFESLPQRDQERGDVFRMRFATLQRRDDHSVVIAAALATANSFGSPRSLKRTRADLLASATVVGPLGARPEPVCETLRFNDLGQLDLLWLVDEATQMAVARQQLARAGASVWERARADGLDFRMAVIGMGQQSKDGLCRPDVSSAQAFFGPRLADLTPFQSCLRIPSGREPQHEEPRGIARLKNTLDELTPAMASGVGSLRSGAVKAVIAVSDRAPAGVVDLFQGTLPDPLSITDRQQLASHLAPLTNSMREAGLLAHAVVSQPDGTPEPGGPGCGSERGVGYIEISQPDDGVVTSICQPESELVAALTRALDDLAARASPIALRANTRLVRGSLSVRLNDRVLEVAPIVGDVQRRVIHDAKHNTLVLRGVAAELTPQKNVVEIAYLGW
ncbi:MAG: hypothetical protein KC503_39025 [Myxococcales bacterium]|nr:hypothetical protein [Myxococcales bacterium]